MFKTVSIFSKLSVKITLLCAFFFTSLIIALALLMGSQSGNFVVQVQSGDIEASIAITENLNQIDTYVDKITTDGIGNISNNTAIYFMNDGVADLKEMTVNTGVNKELVDLYCYTFYVANTGDSIVNIEFEMSIAQVTKNLDKAIRVMSFNGNSNKYTIYQAIDEPDWEYPSYESIGQPRMFKDDRIVYTEQDYLLPMGANNYNDEGSYIKYSVFV
jgi:hypothetical protein